MSDRYPGGLIRKTPPTITPPVDGEGGSAPGIWTLEQASYHQGTGEWPKPILPKELYVWGSNYYGALGIGTSTPEGYSDARSSPVQVGSPGDWVSMASQDYSALAVSPEGRLYAWGKNTNGDLGLNDRVNRSSPTQVGALTNWEQVSVGENYFTAKKTDGTIWAAGKNVYGLGNSGVTLRSSPVQIGTDTDWSIVATGQNTTFGVKNDGSLYAWGSSQQGAMGNGTEDSSQTPLQIGALTTWLDISAGFYQAIAVKTDGTLWGWGYNNSGLLGQNNRISKSSPVQVGALTNWSQQESGRFVGYDFAGAIKTDGTIWLMGENANGQMGQNEPAYILKSSPVQVGTETNWKAATAGYTTTTAIKTDGTLWAWGGDDSGVLGQNTFGINKSSPVQIGAETTWTSVSNSRCMNGYQVGALKT